MSTSRSTRTDFRFYFVPAATAELKAEVIDSEDLRFESAALSAARLNGRCMPGGAQSHDLTNGEGVVRRAGHCQKPTPARGPDRPGRHGVARRLCRSGRAARSARKRGRGRRGRLHAAGRAGRGRCREPGPDRQRRLHRRRDRRDRRRHGHVLPSRARAAGLDPARHEQARAPRAHHPCTPGVSVRFRCLQRAGHSHPHASPVRGLDAVALRTLPEDTQSGAGG